MKTDDDYWDRLVGLLFNQFDEKTGSVGDIKIYKPSELDYVEASNRIADIWFEELDLEHPQSIIDLHADGWFSAIDIFEFLEENLSDDFEVEYETLLSYTVTGFTGSVVSYHYFRINNQAILAEVADGFTPGLYKLKPVKDGIDLTDLTRKYFLREKSVPDLDNDSLELNEAFINRENFLKGLDI